MSFTCYKCGVSLDPTDPPNGTIPLIGVSRDARLEMMLDQAGRHMAAMHPEVMSAVVEASAAIGYLILIENIRTDEPAIETRTKITLKIVTNLADRLKRELSQEAQQELNLRTF